MKKRIMIISLFVLIIIVIVCILRTTSPKLIDKKESKLTCKMEAYTVTDNGTEVDVKLKNDNDKEIEINKIKMTLYNSNNEKIKDIEKEINITLKSKKSLVTKLTLNTQEPTAANVKCSLYS